MSVKSVKRFGSYEHLKFRPVHQLKYRLWCHNYVIVLTFTNFCYHFVEYIMLGICAKFYDHRSKHKIVKAPPTADGSKKPMSNGVERYVPDKILSDSISNKYIKIYRIEKMLITCTTFIRQSVCIKIPDWTFVICAVSLSFMKKIEKGH